MTRVTSHPPPGASAYFMLLLCIKAIHTFLKSYPRLSSQTLKFHSVVSPDPLNACSLCSLGFPKSPPLKNPRSANGGFWLRVLQSRGCCAGGGDVRVSAARGGDQVPDVVRRLSEENAPDDGQPRHCARTHPGTGHRPRHGQL